MEISWRDPYLDRIRWILANLQNLHVDEKETVILLLILYMSEAGLNITHETLSEKSHLSADQIEDIFGSLSDKGYLNIELVGGKLEFLLDGLAENRSVPGMPLDRDLIQDFETEFGRSLSSLEMERILDLARRYDERRVIVALNEAAVYDRRNLNYIENLLTAWNSRGLSIEELESGKR